MARVGTHNPLVVGSNPAGPSSYGLRDSPYHQSLFAENV